MKKTKNRPTILIIETLLVALLMFLPIILHALKVNTFPGFEIFIYILVGVSAYFAIKLSKVDIDFHWKNGKQFVVGICLAVGLSICLCLVPRLCNFSFAGHHIDFNFSGLLYNFAFFFLIVAPVEELLFRVYYQKVFVSFFPKYKWVAVLLQALFFGLFHWIGSSYTQAILFFGLGLVWGIFKEYIDEMHYPGIALSHGLYLFLNYAINLIF